MDRRSFLQFGRSAVAPQTPWESFCHRIQRTVRGEFRDISTSLGAYGAAEIVIERIEDVQHLYAICQEYQVAIALAGFATTDSIQTRHVLFIHFSAQLNHIEELGTQACLAQPSVTAGELLARGYQQFARVPSEMTLVQWFNRQDYHDSRPFHHFLSGVERISVLFADGSQAVLGGFGMQDRSALSVPILNRCIPHLFELLREQAVEYALAQAYWPYDYRLDALQKKLVDINLARIFQGQQARLVWVQQFVIRQIPQDVLLFPQHVNHSVEGWQEHSINDVLHRCKGLFDIDGVFLYDDEVSIA